MYVNAKHYIAEVVTALLVRQTNFQNDVSSLFYSRLADTSTDSDYVFELVLTACPSSYIQLLQLMCICV